MNRDVYLDKVVQYLVEDTMIDWRKKQFILPFFPVVSHPFSTFFSFRPTTTTDSSYYRYFRDTYGLTKEETDYVWSRYRNVMVNKFENGR